MFRKKKKELNKKITERKIEQCAHRKYTLREMKTREWLKDSSFAYDCLQRIVTDKTVLKDLKHLTNFNHTGTLKV